MATHSQRFAVRSTTGARSSEWLVMWKPAKGDVYIATRTLGQTMKVSLHTSGRCHVRAPQTANWLNQVHPPAILDAWDIDPGSNYQFPFAVMIPGQELRRGFWLPRKDKGTHWLEVDGARAIEVGVFLVRATGNLTAPLAASGWHTLIADAPLPDGRRLVVAARTVSVPGDKLAELERFRADAREHIARRGINFANPRMMLLAGPDPGGTRKFVEVAVLPAD